MLRKFLKKLMPIACLLASPLIAQDNYFAQHKFNLSGEDLYSALHCAYSEFESSLLYYMRMGNEGHSLKIFEDYFSKVKDEIDFVALDNTSKFLFIRVSYKEIPTIYRFLRILLRASSSICLSGAQMRIC